MNLLQGDTIAPIQEFWRESYVAIQEIESAAPVLAADSYKEISNFVITLVLIIFLIFAHRRLIDGVKYVFSAIINQKLLFTIENQSNIQVCRNTLFLFLTLCTSFVFANISQTLNMPWGGYPVHIKFIGILIFILLYFAFRRFALQLLTWVNESSIFKVVDKITYTYVSVWYILILSAFIVIKHIPSMLMGNMYYCLIFSMLSVIALFIASLYKIFISKGFSHFFIILYLCTLEILPMALLLYVNFS